MTPTDPPRAPLDLEAALAAMTRERDAYRKAKAENDERFMCERDEARARVRELEAALVAERERVADARAVTILECCAVVTKRLSFEAATALNRAIKEGVEP